MKRFKWFWLTFGSWCLIGATSAWALIYSSTHMNTTSLSEFTAQINKMPIHSRILITSTPMELSGGLLAQEWRDEGWKLVCGKSNLARILFRPPNDLSSALDSLAQIRIFQKGDSLRLLALWNDLDHGQTYQWITEVPKKSLEPQDPATVQFPLRPPANARDPLLLKTKNTEILSWLSKDDRDPEVTLRSLYLSQGFSGHLLGKKSKDPIYILQNGTTRLVGMVEKEASQNRFTLVNLKIK